METNIVYAQPNSTYTVEWQIFQYDAEYDDLLPYNVQTLTFQTEKTSKRLHTGTFDDCLDYIQNSIN